MPSKDSKSRIPHILNYDEETLADVLSNTYITPAEVKKKDYYKFFVEYLGKNPDALYASKIVIEEDYISKSYLYDYANYYALCFSDEYKRKCKRIHFFRGVEKDEDIIDGLINNKRTLQQRHYLGYIVKKELPSNIGTTIIKTYTSRSKSRNYVTRNYFVNFFGMEFSLESLAFQSQDEVISACATSALWMCFHKLSVLFQTEIPTPHQITLSSKSLIPIPGRMFPNDGLDDFQIWNAIEKLGLEYEYRHKEELIQNVFRVRSFIYSYLKLDIPVLLGIHLQEPDDFHLVTISGYQDPDKDKTIKNAEELNLKSHYIEMFYVHDDHVGPYSRFELLENHDKDGFFIQTSWTNSKGKQVLAKVETITVPIYKKIRITFENIYEEVSYIQHYFDKIFNPNILWDIYLYESNKYKKEIHGNNTLTGKFKRKILFTPLPKYIWIARAIIDGEITIFELIFDTTDIEKGFYCLLINCYDLGMREELKVEVENVNVEKYFDKVLNLKYLDLIRNQLI